MENKVHCDVHGFRPGTPKYQAALKQLALVAEREDFVEVGAVCPRCALLYYVGQDAAQKHVDKLIGEADELRQRVAPGDVLVEWARTLSRCPRCNIANAVDVSWRERRCCRVGLAVGQAEGRLVANTLMEIEPSAGGGPTQSGSSSVGFTGKTP
jgi:uncharacterized C2H2 Zn-finger protein